MDRKQGHDECFETFTTALRLTQYGVLQKQKTQISVDAPCFLCKQKIKVSECQCAIPMALTMCKCTFHLKCYVQRYLNSVPRSLGRNCPNCHAEAKCILDKETEADFLDYETKVLESVPLGTFKLRVMIDSKEGKTESLGTIKLKGKMKLEHVYHLVKQLLQSKRRICPPQMVLTNLGRFLKPDKIVSDYKGLHREDLKISNICI